VKYLKVGVDTLTQDEINDLVDTINEWYSHDGMVQFIGLVDEEK
jgi:hypothetical protein